MAVTVVEIYDLSRSRRGHGTDVPEGVVATDLTETPSAPQVVSVTGAIQVNANCLAVKLQNDDTIAYARVSPKTITTTGAALASSASYWHIPAGGELTLGVHGGAIVHLTI